MKKIIDKAIFTVFIISAATMDSNNLILPSAICLVSVVLLYIACKMEEKGVL